MPRQPKPWHWKARGAWYVQINGKQIRLHEDKRKAEQEFYRIMAADGRLDERQRRSMTVADACEALCAQVQTMRASTRRHYSEKLGLFAECFGRRKLHDISPPEVIRWISEYQPPALDSRGRPRRRWGDNSRAMQFGYVGLLYKWARDTGLIEINPFVRVGNPWKIKDRERGMSPHEYEDVMLDPSSSDEFKEIVELVWRVGARPGELAVLAARHLDSKKRIARLQPTEHKTGTRTGAQREIHFPPDLWERLKKYAELRPAGTLLRRPNGKPWTAGLITLAFSRAKRRLDLDCVLYQARHSYFTNLEANGVSAPIAAKLGGHRKLDTFMNTYYHPDTDRMQEGACVTAETEAERMARIRREAEEVRAAAEAERAEHKRRVAREKKQRYRAKKRLDDSDT
jgi:integrase